jgi:gas vesicle protein
LKASLFSGKTDNQSDTAKKIMRQQKKMESEMDAARARQNAEMQRQQMDIWDLQNKQRMQEWKKNY